MLLLPRVRTYGVGTPRRKGCKGAARGCSDLADVAFRVAREAGVQRGDDLLGREALQILHFLVPRQAQEAVGPGQVALPVDLRHRPGADRADLLGDEEGIVVLDLDERVPMAGAQRI